MNLDKILAEETLRCTAPLRSFEPEKNHLDTILNYAWTYQRCESEFIDAAARILKEFITANPGKENYAIENFSVHLNNFRRLYKPPKNPNPATW
jgi:hypothetical protein